MTFPWKNLLLTMLGILVPLLYSLIVSKFPDIPITQDNFMALIVYFVGLLIGGWNAKAFFSRQKLM